jgi:hypothetical protein
VSVLSVTPSRELTWSMLRRYCSSAACCERNVIADAVPDGSSLGTEMRLPLDSCACRSCTRARLACRPRRVLALMLVWVTRKFTAVTDPRGRCG